MPSQKGKIVLMGSGEMTATMVEVHKDLLAQLKGSRQAAFLDTPAGFQLNVDHVSRKAVDYFQAHVQHPLSVASFKSRNLTGGLDAERAFRTLRESAYILIGPGSPTYALDQWRESPVPEILLQCVAEGGCLVAASAAALTVGRFTLPVYEIYKVGKEPHWVEGLNLLGRFGIHLVVVPHWNNAEGGSHDTRCCFMGKSRFLRLEELLADQAPVLGIDEHTACILDFEADEALIKGIGGVTLRSRGHETRVSSGERFPLGVLRGEAFDYRSRPSAKQLSPGTEAADRGPDSFWDRIHALEDVFLRGLSGRDVKAATNALLELDRLIWRAQNEEESADVVVQARDGLRELMVRLGAELASSPRTAAECLAPLVEGLLELRSALRSEGQWSTADEIRDILRKAHVIVEDTETGVRWRMAP
jgi:peptidase E